MGVPFRKSLAFRLLLLSIILLALPLLIDSFIIVQRSYEHAIEEAKRYLLEVSRTREIPLAELQPVKKPFLLMVEYFFNLRKEFPSAPNEATNQKLAQLSATADVDEILFLKLTPEGRYVIVASNQPSTLGKDYANFMELVDIYSPDDYERGYFSYVIFDPKSLQPIFILGRVVFKEGTEEPVGVLLISQVISDEIKNFLKADIDRYRVDLALLSPNTVVLASSNPKLEFNYFEPISLHKKRLIFTQEPFVEKLLAKHPLAISYDIGYPYFIFNFNGQRQIAYMKKIEGSDLYLLVFASQDNIYKTPLRNFLKTYGSYGLILVIGSLLAFLITYRLSLPMKRLSQTMGEIQKGNLAARYIPDKMGFEINDLGIVFNEMIDTLLEKEQAVQKEKAQREAYAQELKIGRQAQESLLLQQMPSFPGVDLAGRYIPAKEVGGDFFDVIVKDGPLFLIMADASGKGVSACFYSLSVRSSFRIFARVLDNVEHLHANANHLFVQDAGDTGMFITALLGKFQGGELSYTSAGHNPPIVRHKDGSVVVLPAGGTALGLQEIKEVSPQKIKLESGDIVLFYTDGITEAHNAAFEQFSEERIVQFLEKNGKGTAKEIADRLIAEVNNFVGKVPQHDDISLIVMRMV